MLTTESKINKSKKKKKEREKERHGVTVTTKVEQEKQVYQFHKKYICIPEKKKKGKQDKVYLNLTFLTSRDGSAGMASCCGICSVPYKFPSFFFFLVFLPFSRATPRAYGSSQARGLIRAVAAGLL